MTRSTTIAGKQIKRRGLKKREMTDSEEMTSERSALWYNADRSPSPSGAYLRHSFLA